MNYNDGGVSSRIIIRVLITRQSNASRRFEKKKSTRYLSECLLRPRLLAKVFAAYLLVAHVNPVRQRGHQREYPYGGDYLRRGQYGHPGLERVDDHEEPIDGDGRERQRGRVHARALRVRHDVTEHLAEHPMSCKKKKQTNPNERAIRFLSRRRGKPAHTTAFLPTRNNDNGRRRTRRVRRDFPCQNGITKLPAFQNVDRTKVRNVIICPYNNICINARATKSLNYCVNVGVEQRGSRASYTRTRTSHNIEFAPNNTFD